MSADLKPRAVAVLVALRAGPLTTAQLRVRIGDGHVVHTIDLVVDMRALSLIAQLSQHDKRWYLDHDGLGWLQSHGLDAVQEARLWVAQERGA